MDILRRRTQCGQWRHDSCSQQEGAPLRLLATIWALLILCAIVFPPNCGAEEKSLQELLPRLKPLKPQAALKSFRIEEGFRIELVAAEPDIVDPIAIAFDEHLRMYACEDRDYPFPAEQGTKPLGRVRLLEDVDGDGRYERSTVFAEHVHWPSGVVCYQGGVFVAAPPQILYLKDTDGDRRADVRKVVFDGFGTAAAEDIMNNLKWGLDNRIYGVASYNGGEVRRQGDGKSEAVSVRGSSFRFDPITFEFERLPGTGDFGNCFDDWGNRFVTNAGQLLMHPVYGEPYLVRNPHLNPGDVLHRSASAKREMYSISPPEPWRVVRKQFWDRWVNTTHDMRASRFSDAELAERGFVTGAAGAAIYRGSAWPAEYHGNSFTAEPAGNVIIRMRVEPNGVTFDALPTSDKREFLASTDNWFRPVNVANGPDGSLYVCDMYRELIEDPSAIPEDILKLMDVTSGRDRGRVYRIVHDSSDNTTGPHARGSVQRLGEAATGELVAALTSPNAWTRETAQRLLIERQDKSAIAPLRELIANSDSAKTRLHALWANEALDANDEETLLIALKDEHPAVREHAVRISQRHMNSHPRVARRIVELVDDENARVRYQAAFTLGELTDRESAISALATIAAQDADDDYVRTAILSSVPTEAGRLLESLSKKNLLKRGACGALLEELVRVIAARGDKGEVDQAIAFATSEQAPAGAAPMLVLSLAEGLSGGGKSFRDIIHRQPEHVRVRIDELLNDARTTAADPQQEIERRRQAIQLLRHSQWEKIGRLLSSLLTAHEPAAIQLAAIQSLSAFENEEVASHLVTSWRGLSPSVRGEAAEALLADDDRAKALLDAVQNGKIPAANVDPARQQLLLKHKSAAIRSLAEDVFSKIARPDRAQVVAKYRAALNLRGNAERGAAIFKAHCATCHAKTSDGKLVGPDLATVRNRSPEQLLLQILDPNREVKPQYLNYQAITQDGRIRSGIIVAESKSSITLRRAEGAEDVIARESLESLTSSGLSLMPEGLEKEISHQQMADLLAFLLATDSDPSAPPALEPVGQLKPVEQPRNNPATDEKVELGRRLFFDVRLSGNERISCATCHDPAKGFSSGERFAEGVNGKPTARHVPSLINVGYATSLFWDGRAATLEEQAIQPIRNPAEMNMPLDQLTKKLNEDKKYREQFNRVFAGAATAERVAQALAAYERTLVSNDTPFDRYLAGDERALSDRAVRGMRLFIGRARCSTCHQGPALTDNRFHNVGTAAPDDFGRRAVTGRVEDHGAFRTPQLREVGRTAPYMHDGQFASLEQVVQHYNFGGVAEHENEHRDEILEVLYLGEDEVQDLVAFLEEGLTSLRTDTAARP